MKSTTDRRNRIIHKIKSKGSVRVNELSEKFEVSTVTIRNDLNFLEEKGLVHRTYGGALLRNSVYQDPSIKKKKKINTEEKERIGKYAAGLINKEESIILDSGSTTRELALNLKSKKNITILTNAINIGLELVGSIDIQTMITGGALRHKSYSLVGSEAEKAIQNYYFDKTFLGIDGIDTKFGLTTSNPQEAQLNRLMVKRSNTVIAVTDSSKFGRHSFCHICGLAQIDMIITDDNISSKMEKKLNRYRIDIVKV